VINQTILANCILRLKRSVFFNLENAVGREKDMPVIGAHGKFLNRVAPNALRGAGSHLIGDKRI